MKDPLVRFSVAIGGELLQKFDQYRQEHHYPNRSEAVRGLMRSALIEEVVGQEESEAMGVVTLIYDHHAGGISERLTTLQHGQIERVVTTTHVHLDEHRCLEVILLRGRTGEIRRLADSLIGVKGIETGRLVLAAAQPVAGARGHTHDHDHDHSHNHSHGHGHDHEHEHDHGHQEHGRAKKRGRGHSR